MSSSNNSSIIIRIRLNSNLRLITRPSHWDDLLTGGCGSGSSFDLNTVLLGNPGLIELSKIRCFDNEPDLHFLLRFSLKLLNVSFCYRFPDSAINPLVYPSQPLLQICDLTRVFDYQSINHLSTVDERTYVQYWFSGM